MPQHPQQKLKKVLKEFSSGSLKSGSGQKVTSRKQALAIALSEAGMSRKKKKKKRSAMSRLASSTKKAFGG